MEKEIKIRVGMEGGGMFWGFFNWHGGNIL